MILIKSKKEISIMREAGIILAKIMDSLEKEIKPDITTEYLDKVASGLVLKYGVKPSFKGYRGFPATLCTSINEEVVHAIPCQRKLKQGDLISLDLGVMHKQFHSDMAKTFIVGKNNNPEVLRLAKVTKKALKMGIKKSRIGNTFGDIGNTIQRHIESQGFCVVKDLCGHGIGKSIHEDPDIPNFGKRNSGIEIKEGMVFCLEPITAMGSCEIEKANDKYGYKTKDNSLSCHFEHTIAVTKNGPKVLTLL